MVVNESYYFDPVDGTISDKLLLEVGGRTKEWPALIGPYGSHNPTIVREDVVAEMERASFSGIEFSEVVIHRVKAKSMKSLKAPNYYSIRPNKTLPMKLILWAQSSPDEKFHVVYDEDWVGGPSKEFVKIAKTFRSTSMTRAPLPLDVGETDFFEYHPNPYYGIGCSFRFIQLARDCGWNNIYATTGHSTERSQNQSIDKLPWPPSEKWVSIYQEFDEVAMLTNNDQQVMDGNRE